MKAAGGRLVAEGAVWSLVVVVDEPGVDLGAELTKGVEASSMERGTPALLQRGALESFAHTALWFGNRGGVR